MSRCEATSQCSVELLPNELEILRCSILSDRKGVRDSLATPTHFERAALQVFARHGHTFASVGYIRLSYQDKTLSWRPERPGDQP